MKKVSTMILLLVLFSFLQNCKEGSNDKAKASETSEQMSIPEEVVEQEAVPVESATAEKPISSLEGSYGFNWLDANSECDIIPESRVDESDYQEICEGKGPGTPFGGPEVNSWFTCKTSEHVEYIIFENRKTCIEQYETMQANGP